MRLEQGKLCLCIRKAEQSFKQLFSQKRAFSEHMEKWQDDDGPCFKDHGTAEGDHSGDESVVECRKEGRCVDAEAHEQERDRV